MKGELRLKNRDQIRILLHRNNELQEGLVTWQWKL